MRIQAKGMPKPPKTGAKLFVQIDGRFSKETFTTCEIFRRPAHQQAPIAGTSVKPLWIHVALLKCRTSTFRTGRVVKAAPEYLTVEEIQEPGHCISRKDCYKLLNDAGVTVWDPCVHEGHSSGPVYFKICES